MQYEAKRQYLLTFQISKYCILAFQNRLHQSDFVTRTLTCYGGRSAQFTLPIYIIMKKMYTAVQSQKALSAFFTSKQILPFGFEKQYSE